MTSSEFLKNEVLVKSLQELLNNETLKIALEIVRADGPIHDEKPTSDPLVHYGEIRGHARYDDKLKSLAVLSPVRPTPKRNYGVKTDA